MPDPIVKKVLGSLGQIVTETVEKTAKETMNIASGVITGQELVGDIKPLSEEAMAKAKAEEEEKKQEELGRLRQGTSASQERNVEKEMGEIRDEKKRKEEEEEKQFLENLKRQRETEAREREQLVDETVNPEREAKKKQFVPGPKKKQQPDPFQTTQTGEFKGKID
ncbi:MAG: hypothetical protein AAB574_03030 [Patescibacteria group bacterium]